MTDLSELLVKLEAAEGPSRELDAELHTAFKLPRERYLWRDPAYTASLDAITALVERVFPGWSWAVSSDYYPEELGAPPEIIQRAILIAPRNGGEWDGEWGNGSPALALCIALVKAKQAEATP